MTKNRLSMAEIQDIMEGSKPFPSTNVCQVPKAREERGMAWAVDEDPQFVAALGRSLIAGFRRRKSFKLVEIYHLNERLATDTGNADMVAMLMIENTAIEYVLKKRGVWK